EIVEGMGHDRGGDRSGVGDAEGAVVAEGPYVVRRGAEAGGEAVATAEVLVGGVNGLRARVEALDAAGGADVPRAGRLPHGAGLAVGVLAAEPDRLGDGRVGPSAPSVGIRTLGGLGLRVLDEVGPLAAAGGGLEEPFEGVGLAHH